MPLGGKGSLHPGVPLQSKTESRLEESGFDTKTGLASKEKRLIAAEAVKLISSGDSIFLDGGSTVMELASLLADRSGLEVVTNSLREAPELSNCKILFQRQESRLIFQMTS